MPVITAGALQIDYADEGAGPTVVLVHSSASGNRQWRALTDALKPRYRVLAPNLFGYGQTTPWTQDGTQTLTDQARLVRAVCDLTPGSVSLVGHSFGGSVAFEAARALGPRVAALVLLEPNPFYLLPQQGRADAWAEASALRDIVKTYGATGAWDRVAERFAVYWTSQAAWDAMPEKRRVAFAQAIQPNFFEWDGALNERATLADWGALQVPGLVVSAPDTVFTIRDARHGPSRKFREGVIWRLSLTPNW
jgi:pimeloyl-ACP methyl ester carboxylesterase